MVFSIEAKREDALYIASVHVNSETPAGIIPQHLSTLSKRKTECLGEDPDAT